MSKRGRNPWKKILSNMRLSSRRRYHVNEDTKAEVRKTRVYEITVTEKQLSEIFERQNGRCYWTGVCIDPQGIFIPNNPFAISADRLDNSKDYCAENIVLTTRFANLGRGNTPAPIFEEMMRSMLTEIKGL